MSVDPTHRPFVGREAELAEIAAALRDASAGRGSVVQITGEAGIGKTRLALEAEALASRDRFRVVRARGWDGGHAPAYWPWIELVRALARESGAERLRERLGASLATVVRMLPDLAHDLGVAVPRGGARPSRKAERFRFFDAVARLVRDLARAEPLLAVLDDFHAADEDSLELLRFVARGIRQDRILVLVTIRDEDVRRSPATRRMLAEIGRDGFTLPLRGLGAGDVSRVAAAGLGREAEAALVAKLVETTGGNPLYVEEIVRELRSRDGSAAPRDAFVLPEGIREVARRRLEGLPAAERSLLDAASVLGPELDVGTLAEVAGCAVASVRKALDRSFGRGLLRELSGPLGRYALGPVLCETLRGDLRAEVRAALHGRAGEVLERRFPDEVFRIAAHYFEAIPAGYGEEAVRAAARAGRAAVRRLAWGDAVVELRRALEALGEPGDPAGRRRRARLARDLEGAERELRKETARSAVAPVSPPSRPPVVVGSSRGETPVATCRREGGYWAFEYGGRSSRFRATRGFDYVAFLLRNPDVDIPAIDLVRRHAPAAGAETSSLPPGEAGEILDDRARSEYRRRLSALREQLAEADRHDDLGRATRAREEIETLTAELGAAFGLGGRRRRASSDLERARVAVTKPVRNAIRTIRTVDERLGTHLEASVRTGFVCTYSPGRAAGTGRE